MLVSPRTLRCWLLAVPVAVAAGLTVVPAPAGAATSPAALYQASVAATGHQTSMGYQVVVHEPHQTLTVVGQAGPHAGRQTVTVHQGSTTGHLAVLVTGGTAYVRGDTSTLEDYLDLPSPIAILYPNRWLSFTPSSSYYASITSGVLLASAVGQTTLSGPYSGGRSTSVGGVPTVAVQGWVANGGARVPETVDVATTGAHLPVAASLSAKTQGGRVAVTYRFGPWGHKVAVAVPPHVVPFPNPPSDSAS